MEVIAIKQNTHLTVHCAEVLMQAAIHHPVLLSNFMFKHSADLFYICISSHIEGRAAPITNVDKERP